MASFIGDGGNESFCWETARTTCSKGVGGADHINGGGGIDIALYWRFPRGRHSKPGGSTPVMAATAEGDFLVNIEDMSGSP